MFDKDKTEEQKQDIMIRATRYAGISKQDLLKTFNSHGLIAVYNLGLENMLDYLTPHSKKFPTYKVER